MQLTQRSRENGFTVVELVLTMMIMSLVIGVFGIMITGAYGEADRSSSSVRINRQMHNAMDSIEADVRTTVRFKTSGYDGYDTTTQDYYGKGVEKRSDADPYIWRHTSSGSDVSLLLLQYATSIGRGSSIREPVYIKTSMYNCADQKVYQPKYKRLVVYFLRDGNLYRRTLYNRLMNQDNTPYTGILSSYFCMSTDRANDFLTYAKASIPREAIESPSYAPTAGSVVYADVKLASNVVSFDATYYEGEDPVPNQYDTTKITNGMLDNADRVRITLKLESPTKNVSSSQSLTIRKVNNP